MYAGYLLEQQLQPETNPPQPLAHGAGVLVVTGAVRTLGKQPECVRWDQRKAWKAGCGTLQFPSLAPPVLMAGRPSLED